MRFVPSFLLAIPLLVPYSGGALSAPVVYTDEATFLSDLTGLGYAAVHESFEDEVVWADSRNSIVDPGSTLSITSQGIVWTSNYIQNEIATGTVGGSAPDGDFAIYSLPHGMTTDSGPYCDSAEEPDIPVECYQNDGLKIELEDGGMMYAFGGRIDTGNDGKVTFLLDGVDINANDTDNIDNWQREGELADGWAFVGVIDTEGFLSAELRELRGKDYQQVLLFTDDFTVGVSQLPEPIPGDLNGDGTVGSIDLDIVRANWGQSVAPGDLAHGDADGDGAVGSGDLDSVRANWGVTGTAAVPEPHAMILLAVAMLSLPRPARRR